MKANKSNNHQQKSKANANNISKSDTGKGLSVEAPALDITTSLPSVQRMLNDKESTQSTQLKKGNNSTIQKKGNNSTGMPDGVKNKMESAFNKDFSDVNIIQNSPNASKVGALAYTQGKDIHFAEGQYNPKSKSGQELLGHELTHVVQQSESDIKPTTSANGMPVNDDKGLEKEADDMGRKAAAHETAPPVQNKLDSDNSNIMGNLYGL